MHFLKGGFSMGKNIIFSKVKKDMLLEKDCVQNNMSGELCEKNELHCLK